MKKIFVLSTIIIFSFSLVFAQNSVKYRADKAKTYITYSMSHPLHKWDATSKDVASVLVYNNDTKLIEKVATAVPVSTFDSQNANRDSHMIEVVEGIKFPNVTFSSTSIIGTFDKMTITGTLDFHGVPKKIIFEASAKITDDGIEVNGAFNVKMSEFEIESPSLMGITTKDLIEIKFHSVYLFK